MCPILKCFDVTSLSKGKNKTVVNVLIICTSSYLQCTCGDNKQLATLL